ncbi:succinate--CoA ligase subunit alpha [bacterium]|nr:succinate--CoA ligase subunit alpha [bacterium]
MSILIHKNSKVLVQGITGKEGMFHAKQMLEYGTLVVGGCTPGKGGTKVLDKPVFNTVAQGRAATGADTSIIFVPAPGAADAILEAAHAGIGTIVCITEGVPIQDMVPVHAEVKRLGARLIGPNCPGLITPGECKLGIMPAHIFSPGPVGFVSRSGTLTYQAVDELSRNGLGQSTCVGIGGDPIIGTSFLDCVKMFLDDPATKALVLIGEIGGGQEEEAAAYLVGKKIPTVAMIAGRTAPPGKRMGHAGAIVSGGVGTAQGKVDAFEKAGIPVSDTTQELVAELKKRMATANV